MKRFRQSCFCAALTFAVYLATMPPSLTWAHAGADGGDLASAVARGALPHPPGFPAYMLLGALFAQFPLGELAWRLNVLSAFSAAGAVALTVATAQRLGARDSSACIAGLSLAFAPLFWSQAIIVEVYAVAAFCAAFLFYLAARDAPVWLRGFALGVSLGAHPTLIFLFPFVVRDLSGFQKPDRSCPPQLFVRQLVSSLFSLLLGWLAMYTVALPALNRAPSGWGDASTLDGWWAFVSAEIYRGFAFALPLADLPARVGAFGVLGAQQFTPVGAVIALSGLVALARARRAFAFAAVSAGALVTIFAIGYNTADSFVYLINVLPLGALGFAIGVSNCELRIAKYELRFTFYALRCTSCASWIVPIFFLLLLFVQFVLNYPALNLHENRDALQWATRVLADAPPNAIVVTARDAHTFTLWYARDALHARPDVIVLDRDLWWHAPYRAMMRRAYHLPDDWSAALETRPVILIEEPIP